MAPLRIGIVGTRKPRPAQIARVFDIVRASPSDAVIVSGGAEGIDTEAHNAARLYKREMVVHRPKEGRGLSRAAELLSRNGDIVGDSDVIHALPGMTNGTWDTIFKADRAKVHLFRYGSDGVLVEETWAEHTCEAEDMGGHPACKEIATLRTKSKPYGRRWYYCDAHKTNRHVWTEDELEPIRKV